ncbi:hypothetical protein P3S68_033950 [Capsicum galapagoense]
MHCQHWNHLISSKPVSLQIKKNYGFRTVDHLHNFNSYRYFERETEREDFLLIANLSYFYPTSQR